MGTRPKILCLAAPASGTGKTLATLGVAAALRRRGMLVQSFKVGPDYIDPGHLTAATGRPCRNLDSFFLPPEEIRALVDRVCLESPPPDILLIEGAMGLYDGAKPDAETGSTAEIAKMLGAGVLFVVSPGGMARSIAALVKGFIDFDPALRFVGVLLNRVGSDRHRALLTTALGGIGVPVLGALPKDAGLALESRHLGLVLAEEAESAPARFELAADLLEARGDLDALLAVLPVYTPAVQTLPRELGAASPVRLGVARDAAFAFYYAENLRLLEAFGAELIHFSPTADRALPPDLDALYLGGGYPELHAQTLSENQGMREAIQTLHAAGKPIYAECGGFMYGMESLDIDGRTWPMLGLFPLRSTLHRKRQGLGYRTATFKQRTILGPAGTRLKGHEFRYSGFLDAPTDSVYAVHDAQDAPVDLPGVQVGSALGSYFHAYFGSNPCVAAAFVEAAARVKSTL